MPDAPNAIAYYLPQYHPIPENDAHWGTGFTEWNNVVRAKPLFPGHHQPHLPADLGFYDLRVDDVRQKQRELALEAGIRAFAVYHYWFHGRRLMDRPVDAFFTDPVHEVKYLLCWANERWTLEWRGAENITTIDQQYSAVDDEVHAEFLTVKFFSNPRYFCIEGKPVFLVYHAHDLPNANRTVEALRAAARRRGKELLLGACIAFTEDRDVREWGFDFAVRWAPNWLAIQRAHDERTSRILKVESKFLSRRHPRFRHNTAYDYDLVRREHLRVPKPEWPTCETAFPSWDNTARRANGDALIVTNPSVMGFQSWLHTLASRLRAEDPNLVFINAWNEWAEGCHLEPDDRWGHQWLAACRDTFGPGGSASKGPPAPHRV